MITEIVTFDRHPGMDRNTMIEDAASTFDRWTDFPGLIRKMFVRDPDSLRTMGIYLWESLADADKGHDAAWLERAEAHWGNRPTLERFDCFTILENPGGKVIVTDDG
jgi:hypothetical protein